MGEGFLSEGFTADDIKHGKTGLKRERTPGLGHSEELFIDIMIDILIWVALISLLLTIFVSGGGGGVEQKRLWASYQLDMGKVEFKY